MTRSSDSSAVDLDVNECRRILHLAAEHMFGFSDDERNQLRRLIAELPILESLRRPAENDWREYQS